MKVERPASPARRPSGGGEAARDGARDPPSQVGPRPASLDGAGRSPAGNTAHESFPIFLRLAGRRVLVVGGGPVAAGRVAQLAAAGARVAVVAPEVRPEIPPLAAEVHRRPFAGADLDGAWFAVAAAPPEVNRAVSSAAEARQIFVNAVDDLQAASAWCGGIVRRGGVTLALSTGASAPALSGLLREALEALLPDDLGRWADEARRLRAAWKREQVPMPERRPILLRALNALYDARVRSS